MTSDDLVPDGSCTSVPPCLAYKRPPRRPVPPSQLYFGPALEKYAGRRGETYRTALRWRATLLMSGAAICLSKLQLASGSGEGSS